MPSSIGSVVLLRRRWCRVVDRVEVGGEADGDGLGDGKAPPAEHLGPGPVPDRHPLLGEESGQRGTGPGRGAEGDVGELRVTRAEVVEVGRRRGLHQPAGPRGANRAGEGGPRRGLGLGIVAGGPPLLPVGGGQGELRRGQLGLVGVHVHLVREHPDAQAGVALAEAGLEPDRQHRHRHPTGELLDRGLLVVESDAIAQLLDGLAEGALAVDQLVVALAEPVGPPDGCSCAGFAGPGRLEVGDRVLGRQQVGAHGVAPAGQIGDLGAGAGQPGEIGASHLSHLHRGRSASAAPRGSAPAGWSRHRADRLRR